MRTIGVSKTEPWGTLKLFKVGWKQLYTLTDALQTCVNLPIKICYRLCFKIVFKSMNKPLVFNLASILRTISLTFI